MPKARIGPPGRCISASDNPLDSSGDRDFRPDVALKDGEVVRGDSWTIEAVATPGHTANHMIFNLECAIDLNYAIC